MVGVVEIIFLNKEDSPKAMAAKCYLRKHGQLSFIIYIHDTRPSAVPF